MQCTKWNRLNVVNNHDNNKQPAGSNSSITQYVDEKRCSKVEQELEKREKERLKSTMKKAPITELGNKMHEMEEVDEM